MFSWECAKCGRTIDIAETECPFCRKEAGRPAEDQPVAAAAPMSAPQISSSAPQPRASSTPAPVPFGQESTPAPPVAAAPTLPPRVAAAPKPAANPNPLALRTSHLLIGLAALVIAVGGAILLARPELLEGLGGSAAAPVGPGPVWGNASHDDFEIAGVRPFFDPDTNTIKVRYLVINHSDRERLLPKLNVSLRPADASMELPSIASFTIDVPEPLTGYSSHEVVADLAAMGTVQSIPPWQDLRVQLSTIGPAAGPTEP